PADTMRVNAFFTGLAVQDHDITVSAGQTASLDFALSDAGRSTTSDRGGQVVKLSEFVVGESREMAGAAIAINEQRFAANVKNVVSTDEFGFVPEANVAEFLKFVPGVTIENQGNNGRWISIN